MIIYIMNIILSVCFATIATKRGKKKVNSLGEICIEPNHFMLFLSLASLLFVYAARGWTGTDTGLYNSQFENMGNRDLKSIIENDRDWLFSLITYFDYKIFHSVFWHNVIIGMLLYIPIVKIYTEYTDNFPMALFLYIATCAYYFGFNGQRQGVAISLVTLGYPYLVQKKFLAWVVICLFASFFHVTAFLMIPLGYLITKDTDSKAFMIVTIVASVSAFAIWSLWDRMFSILGILGQDKLVNDYSRMNAANMYGSNPIRVIISLVPVLLGIFFYKTLKSPKYCIAINASIWLLIFTIASTRNVFFYRCSAYFATMQIFIFFYLEKIFDDKSKKYYWIVLSVLYLVYMWVSLHSEGNMLPYNLFFENRFY